MIVPGAAIAPSEAANAQGLWHNGESVMSAIQVAINEKISIMLHPYALVVRNELFIYWSGHKHDVLLISLAVEEFCQVVYEHREQVRHLYTNEVFLRCARLRIQKSEHGVHDALFAPKA